MANVVAGMMPVVGAGVATGAGLVAGKGGSGRSESLIAYFSRIRTVILGLIQLRRDHEELKLDLGWVYSPTICLLGEQRTMGEYTHPTTLFSPIPSYYLSRYAGRGLR
jgi:hypothetical protein